MPTEQAGLCVCYYFLAASQVTCASGTEGIPTREAVLMSSTYFTFTSLANCLARFPYNQKTAAVAMRYMDFDHLLDQPGQQASSMLLCSRLTKTM